MEMEQHYYGMADLRHFMNPTTSGNLFTPAISHPELLSTSTDDGRHHHHQHHHLNNDDDKLVAATSAQAQAQAQSQSQQLEMLISTSSRHQLSTASPGGGLYNHHHHLFRTESSSGANNFSIGGGSSSCLSGDGFGFGSGNGSGRWPRQETLTLLEVRSRLDSKFKEANQKGPLWDQVSRIMCEEHGYQRSGKKCREKFENLYKYYKKTKEGKVGRQDGKHYRFFRQLEALYGESSTTNPTTSLSETPHLGGIGSINFPYTTTQPNNQEVFHQPPRQLCDDSLTPSNSSAFYTSSSDDCCSEDLNAAAALKRIGKRSWKAKIRDFLDGQMRKLTEKQDTWLEKMMKSIEHKEQERMLREEEWRKQEAARIDREHKFWAKERACIESRDAGLMEALHRLTGLKELKVASNSSPETDHDQELVIMRAYQVQNDNGCETITNSSDSWQECEITRLIQLRTSMEPMFVRQNGVSEGEALWEEIASNMACLGYENRSAAMCKDKWDSISSYLMKNKDQCSIKKRKENDNNSINSSYFYFQNNESICNNQGGDGAYRENNELGCGGLELTRSFLTQSEHHVNSSRPPPMQGSSFRFFMGDEAENLWENYGLKLSKGDNQPPC